MRCKNYILRFPTFALGILLTTRILVFNFPYSMPLIWGGGGPKGNDLRFLFQSFQKIRFPPIFLISVSESVPTFSYIRVFVFQCKAPKC